MSELQIKDSKLNYWLDLFLPSSYANEYLPSCAKNISKGEWDKFNTSVYIGERTPAHLIKELFIVANEVLNEETGSPNKEYEEIDRTTKGCFK